MKALIPGFTCVAISCGTGTAQSPQTRTQRRFKHRLPPSVLHRLQGRGTECSGNALPLSSCSVAVHCGGRWCVCLSCTGVQACSQPREPGPGPGRHGHTDGRPRGGRRSWHVSMGAAAVRKLGSPASTNHIHRMNPFSVALKGLF